MPAGRDTAVPGDHKSNLAKCVLDHTRTPPPTRPTSTGSDRSPDRPSVRPSSVRPSSVLPSFRHSVLPSYLLSCVLPAALRARPPARWPASSTTPPACSTEPLLCVVLPLIIVLLDPAAIQMLHIFPRIPRALEQPPSFPPAMPLLLPSVGGGGSR